MKVERIFGAVLMFVLVMAIVAFGYSGSSGFSVSGCCDISTASGDLNFPSGSGVSDPLAEATFETNTLNLDIQHNGDVQVTAECTPYTLSASGYSYDGYALATSFTFTVEGNTQSGNAGTSLSSDISFFLTGGDAIAIISLNVSRTGYADPGGPYSATITITCSAI